MWRRHFAGMQAGTEVSCETLVAETRRAATKKWDDLVDCSEKWVLPTPAETSRIMRSLPEGKATGEDGIGAAEWQALGDRVEFPLALLFFKAGCRVDEPVQWRGGEIMQMWKGKGEVSTCGNSRGVFIESATAKAYHKWCVGSLQTQFTSLDR